MVCLCLSRDSSLFIPFIILLTVIIIIVVLKEIMCGEKTGNCKTSIYIQWR